MRDLTKNEITQLSGGNTSKPLKMQKENAFAFGFVFGTATSFMAFRNGIFFSVLLGVAMGKFFSACSEP